MTGKLHCRSVQVTLPNERTKDRGHALLASVYMWHNTSGAQEGQEKVSGPQVLELQTLVGQTLWCWTLTLKPLEEQPEHLSTELSFQPSIFTPWSKQWWPLLEMTYLLAILRMPCFPHLTCPFFTFFPVTGQKSASLDRQPWRGHEIKLLESRTVGLSLSLLSSSVNTTWWFTSVVHKLQAADLISLY